MENQNKPKTNSTMLIIVGVLILVVSTLGFIIIRGGTQRAQISTEAQTDTAAATEPTGVMAEEVPSATGEGAMTGETETEEAQVFEVEAGSFYYDPNVIRVKEGQTVQIVLNSVSMMHDFVIDELDVRIPVTESGNSATVEFVASQKGEFEYYCSVGQHHANGQVGTLIVE